jgi:hypothetical protein
MTPCRREGRNDGPHSKRITQQMREKRRRTHETPPTRSRESMKCQLDPFNGCDQALVHEVLLCTTACPDGIYNPARLPVAAGS